MSTLSARAVDTIMERLGNRSLACPACSGQEWDAEPSTGFVPIWDANGAGSLNFTGRVNGLPMVVLTCVTCGYSMFFNAVKLNLMGSGQTVPSR